MTRLSRQIKSRDLAFTVGECLTKQANPFVKEDTVLALDLSDISKEHSRKQEGLAPVRDGSTGEIKDGWPILAVVGADVRGDRVIPLYFEISPFKQYAVCDGIYNLLFGRKFCREDKEPDRNTSQLWLPFEISHL